MIGQTRLNLDDLNQNRLSEEEAYSIKLSDVVLANKRVA